MAGKKFYWLKLKRDFFKRHDIRIIEEMPNGKDYILFYLKMLLESIDHEGALRFSETIPYNEQMLSVVTNTNIDVVRSAMKVFLKLRMVEICDDETIYMNEVQRMIGSESASAARVRKHRAKLPQPQQALHSNTDVTKSNTEIEIEKELDTELETDREQDTGAAAPTLKPAPKPKKPPRKKYGEYGWVQLTDDQHERLVNDLGADELQRCIQYVDESAQSSGNKNRWKDWNLVLRRCSREGWGRKARQAAPAKMDTLGVLNRMLEEGE